MEENGAVCGHNRFMVSFNCVKKEEKTTTKGRPLNF